MEQKNSICWKKITHTLNTIKYRSGNNNKCLFCDSATWMLYDDWRLALYMCGTTLVALLCAHKHVQFSSYCMQRIRTVGSNTLWSWKKEVKKKTSIHILIYITNSSLCVSVPIELFIWMVNMTQRVTKMI